MEVTHQLFSQTSNEVLYFKETKHGFERKFVNSGSVNREDIGSQEYQIWAAVFGLSSFAHNPSTGEEVLLHTNLSQRLQY